MEQQGASSKLSETAVGYGNGPWVTAQLSDEFFAYVYKNQQNGLKAQHQRARAVQGREYAVLSSVSRCAQDLLRHWQKPLCDSEAGLQGHPVQCDFLCQQAMELILSMLNVDPLSRPSVGFLIVWHVAYCEMRFWDVPDKADKCLQSGWPKAQWNFVGIRVES